MKIVKKLKIYKFLIRLILCAMFWIPFVLIFHTWKERLIYFVYMFFIYFFSLMFDRISNMLEGIEKE